MRDESERRIDEKDISNEQPLLINPATEDPGDFIEFHRYVIVPKSTDDFVRLKGKTTIEIFKLNDRNELLNHRRIVWSQFKKWEKVLVIGEKYRNQELIDLAKEGLRELTSEDSEFTGMFKYQSKIFD